MSCNCEGSAARPISFMGLGAQVESVGMGDPSSAACREAGGREEIRHDAAGNAQGFCIFPDGTECDSWQVYRKQCGPGVERWDMKGDLIAGGVALALPIAYDFAAPKKWPQLKMWHRVVLVVVGYFGVSYAYRKL